MNFSLAVEVGNQLDGGEYNNLLKDNKSYKQYKWLVPNLTYVNATNYVHKFANELKY